MFPVNNTERGKDRTTPETQADTTDTQLFTYTVHTVQMHAEQSLAMQGEALPAANVDEMTRGQICQRHSGEKKGSQGL